MYSLDLAEGLRDASIVRVPIEDLKYGLSGFIVLIKNLMLFLSEGNQGISGFLESPHFLDVIVEYFAKKVSELLLVLWLSLGLKNARGIGNLLNLVRLR